LPMKFQQERRHCLQRVTAAITAPLVSSVALAQGGSFPSRPLRIIAPFGPGSGSDVISRFVGQKITEETGQPVIVENRVGGGGIVGTLAALQAPADGYTLLLISNTFTVTAGINVKPPYDPL